MTVALILTLTFQHFKLISIVWIFVIPTLFACTQSSGGDCFDTRILRLASSSTRQLLPRNRFDHLMHHVTKTLDSHAILCGTSPLHQGCSSLNAWGAAVGQPLKDHISETKVAQKSQHLSNVVNAFHDTVIEPNTAGVIHELEQLSQIPRLEALLTERKKHLPQTKLEALQSLLLGYHEKLLQLNLLAIEPSDLPEKREISKYIMCQYEDQWCPISQLSEAYAYEGRNAQNVHEFILIAGISESCNQLSQGCLAGDLTIDPAWFEGVYRFSGFLAGSVLPTYTKLIQDKKSPMKTLTFWEEEHAGLNTELLTEGILAAAITPESVAFDSVFSFGRSPAIIAVKQSYQDCTSKGDFGCTSSYLWKLVRVTTGKCSGHIYQRHLCYWDLDDFNLTAYTI